MKSDGFLQSVRHPEYIDNSNKQEAVMPLRTARAIGMFCVALSIGATQIAGAVDFDKGLTAALSGDYAAALQEFRPLAEQGNASAQYSLGVMYDNGHGVPQDYAEAATWYRRAAEQGHASAQYNLGIAYDNGRGVSQNYAEAATWYRKAAEQGDARAQNNLGFMYGAGQGVPQDYVQAHMWFNLSASQGGKDAAYNRDTAAERMTNQQISEAQALARKWVAKNR
jgi:TPR repeat protein